MENIYLKFYEEQKTQLHKDEIGGINLNDYPYLTFDEPFYKLRKEIRIGKLDKKKDFAFLRQEFKDIYIDGDDLKGAMHNDIVLVKDGVHPTVVLVLKRDLTHIIATVKQGRRELYFYTDEFLNKKLNVSAYPNLVAGHVVLLKALNISRTSIDAKVERVIGHINDPDIETLKIVADFDWPTKFSEPLLESIKKIEINIEEEKKVRDYLNNDLIVTIDGADAKDLDDAISLKVIDGNYHLGVHIADVSYYVKEGTLLDQEAYKRATSAYLADRVIPMLPHTLSNDWCSLNPNTDKLTLSCFIVLDENANVLSYEIKKTVINTKMRLTYDAVNQLFKQNLTVGNKEVDSMLFHMLELSKKLAKIRKKRGELEFKSSEIGFKVDEKGRVIDVYERIQDDAEELIESLMLIANEVVATHMYHAELPSIYRIHEKPDYDKLKTALETVSKLGIPVDFKDIGNPKAIQKITNKLEDNPISYVVHMTLLRAMQKAKYSKDQDIHYGLGARFYSHFTSPIRRYPDLLLHRIIHELVLGEASDYQAAFNKFDQEMYERAVHTSEQERKAVQMEREVAKLKSAEYMKNKVGMRFKGMITQMMKSGMFIKLDNGIEGFLSLRTFREYFDYDEQKLMFINAYGESYKLGQRIEVLVKDVDIIEKEIDFELYKKNRKKARR